MSALSRSRKIQGQLVGRCVCLPAAAVVVVVVVVVVLIVALLWWLWLCQALVAFPDGTKWPACWPMFALFVALAHLSNLQASLRVVPLRSYTAAGQLVDLVDGMVLFSRIPAGRPWCWQPTYLSAKISLCAEILALVTCLGCSSSEHVQ